MSQNNPFPDFFNLFGQPPNRSDSGNQQPPRQVHHDQPSKPLGPLAWTLIILLALAGFIYVMSILWTEVLWYNQVGYARILWTRWGATAGMFLLGFVSMYVVQALNTWVAYRVKPLPGGKRRSEMLFDSFFRVRPNPHSPAPEGPEEIVVEALTEEQAKAKEKHDRRTRRLVTWGLPAVFGLVSGMNLAPSWQTLLMWFYRTPFGKTDPEFGLDASFYVFSLPLIEMVVSAIMFATVVGAIIAVVVHYLTGSIAFSPKLRVTKGARIHLAVLAAILSVMFGGRYFLQRYSLLLDTTNTNHGAMYTDINATLPALTILAIIALIIAVLFVVSASKGSWHIPAVGIAVMVVSALVAGVAYPMLIERFRVKPNALALQPPYIERNIKATLYGFGLDNLKYSTYRAKVTATAGQLREDSDTTSQIRLLDPLVIPPTVQQAEVTRPYYQFTDQFAVDRYDIGKEKRDTVIGVREVSVNDMKPEQRTWVNDHTVYTHGFGVVAAYGNQVTKDGKPSYWESGIPSVGDLGKYEPRIYFSPKTTQYSIVGAPKGAAPQELDYPDDKVEKGGQKYNTFQGNGGPSIGNTWNKLLYSIKFGSWDMFFADQVNSKSQILYDRTPLERVAKVAPFLTLEQKPYPAVVDMDGNPNTPKRVVWIVDAYTTTDNYPYSQHVNLDQVTKDSQNRTRDMYSPTSRVNYMRNSVKAVVDAYDGSVKLYQWDKNDPILKTWMKIYPGKVLPMSKISGDLMAHLRYPEDIFKVQRSLLETYHVTDPSSFYTGGDQWKLSEDPTVSASEGSTRRPPQPPYYLTMKMPDQKKAEFSLYSVYVPGGTSKREVMTGFLAVDSETGDQPGKVREGFGQLRLLAMPTDNTVPGPPQVQNNFNNNLESAREINLLNQQGSKIIYGNLLTLPVGGGLLYVEPVYVQSTNKTSFPQLRSVLVAFGERIGYAPTLKEALDQVFGGDSAAQTSSHDGAGTDAGKDKGTDKKDAKKAEPTHDQKVQAALKKASEAMKDADKAMKAGDWKAYGEAQEELRKALQEADSLLGIDSGDSGKTDQSGKSN